MKITRIFSAIILFIILSGHGRDPYPLARIIAGEANTCDRDAKIAVAWIHSRNDKFNGRAKPDRESVLIALNWFELEDTSHGARFWFSLSDLERPAVVEIFEAESLQLTRFFNCAGVLVGVYK